VNAQVKRSSKRASTRGVTSTGSKVMGRAKSLASKAVRRAAVAARALKKAVGKKSVAAKAAKKTKTQKKRTRRKLRGDPNQVVVRLARAIQHPHVELAFGDPWQLLVAVILSAQSTDRRVNQVTPEVFRRWPDPAALAAADRAEVEEVIKSTGFFRNKTKAIVGASALLVERFGGRVPRSMEELLEVPGVARKTANVVLGSAYGVASGIVVDTHAARVAQRLELTSETEPEKIELVLCRAFPQEQWIEMSHRLVLHGRYVCTARAPACSACPLNEICPSRLEPGLSTWEERAAREAAEMESRARGFARV
jgi:endonuclease III